MSEQPVSEFEERLRTLLARTAEAVPPDADLSARVLGQARVRATRRSGEGVGPRHARVLATVAAVVVVALLAGVLTFGRPGGSRRPAGGVTGAPTTTATATEAPLQVTEPPTCDPGNLLNPLPGPAVTPTRTPADHSVAVGRHASVNGITITIDRAYADATQTVISYHMHTNINPPSPVFPVLLDAQGHRYTLIFGDWNIQGGDFSPSARCRPKSWAPRRRSHSSPSRCGLPIRRDPAPWWTARGRSRSTSRRPRAQRVHSATPPSRTTG